MINGNGTVMRASTLPYHGLVELQASEPASTTSASASSIGGCAWVGTVGFGTFSGTTGPAQITITGRAGTNNGLYITTFNGAGTPTNEPFHVIVVC